jgi:hypothetical protein
VVLQGSTVDVLLRTWMFDSLTLTMGFDGPWSTKHAVMYAHLQYSAHYGNLGSSAVLQGNTLAKILFILFFFFLLILVMMLPCRVTH